MERRVHSEEVYHQEDFPGTYLFALLPLPAAALTLQIVADRVGRGL